MRFGHVTRRPLDDPQVIPDVDEELDNIAGELVHDLGATNSVAATLSSTIVGKKGNASLSHAHLRCDCARSRRGRTCPCGSARL